MRLLIPSCHASCCNRRSPHSHPDSWPPEQAAQRETRGLLERLAVQAAAAAELLQELRAAQDARATERSSAAPAASGQPQPDGAAPAAAAAAEEEQRDSAARDAAGARDAAPATKPDQALETLPEQVAALGARVDALGEAQDAAVRATAAQHHQVRALGSTSMRGAASLCILCIVYPNPYPTRGARAALRRQVSLARGPTRGAL